MSVAAADRRTLLAGMGLLVLGGCARADRPAVPDAADRALQAGLAALEAANGGRLGLAVLDSRDGALAGHRIDERFTMCSTFKLSLAALVLARMAGGAMPRDAMLPIAADDPVGHSPVVRAALARGETQMSALALAQAAQEQSDNGASNILLRAIGGPAGLTAFWRALGDDVSRLDRYEPALNTSHGGDPRDTTSPAAMARTMRALLAGAGMAGAGLADAERATLTGWAVATQTGLERLRAGLPDRWRAGDKTGTMTGGDFPDKINDIAILWHPARDEPFLLTGFVESGGKGLAADEAVLAQAARLAAGWIAARA